MALKGKQGVVGNHAGAVVDDLDQFFAAGLHVDTDAGRSGINRVLDEFLDDGCGTLDNFAGGDLVGNVLGKYVDSSHALAVGAARAASDFQSTRPDSRKVYPVKELDVPPSGAWTGLHRPSNCSRAGSE